MPAAQVWSLGEGMLRPVRSLAQSFSTYLLNTCVSPCEAPVPSMDLLRDFRSSPKPHGFLLYMFTQVLPFLHLLVLLESMILDLLRLVCLVFMSPPSREAITNHSSSMLSPVPLSPLSLPPPSLWPWQIYGVLCSSLANVCLWRYARNHASYAALRSGLIEASLQRLINASVCGFRFVSLTTLTTHHAGASAIPTFHLSKMSEFFFYSEDGGPITHETSLRLTQNLQPFFSLWSSS